MDNSTKHIPFAVIVAATNGDEAAIQKILDFYDGYISKLSLRKLYDEYGNVYMVVDSELKGRIQAAVMDMIANFEIIVILTIPTGGAFLPFLMLRLSIYESLLFQIMDFHRLTNTVGVFLTTE